MPKFRWFASIEENRSPSIKNLCGAPVIHYSLLIAFKIVLGPCLHDELVSDGFCDDEANTKSCDYDGGDCCGPNVLIDYCTICECIIEESGNSTGAFVVLP